jgi:NitT/TauT family transport system ATP-binding protein
MSDTKIGIRGLRKWFATRFGRIEALGSLDLEVGNGELCVLVGPSGCGKSTLLRILAGLETASEGTVDVSRSQGGRPLTAMVFQEPSALPWLTVRANVAYGLRMQGVEARSRDAIVDRYLEKVGLSAFARAYPYQLSGGMKQRVSVARAFATDPEILLMDEPFGSLDEQTRLILQGELLRLFEETRKTILFVTHSIDEALTLGDRVVVMSAAPGRILRDIPVPFPRPREIVALRGDPAYGRHVARIWDLLGLGRPAGREPELAGQGGRREASERTQSSRQNSGPDADAPRS